MRALRVLRRPFVWSKLKGLWREAFPAETDVGAKFAQRREEKKRMREAAEAKAALHPEGEPEEPLNPAKDLVFVKKLEDQSYFGKSLMNKINHYSKDDPNYQQMLREWQSFRESTSELKGRLHQRLVQSDSVVVKTAISILDAYSQKLHGKVLEEIMKKDPNFDLETFEEEAKFIFEKAYSAYLKHDVKYLAKVCGGDALGFFKGLITVNEERNSIPRYHFPLNVSLPVIESINMLDGGYPLFSFSIHFDEVYCMQDKDTGDIIDGNESKMTSSNYVFWIMPHEEPDVESVGHDWVIVRVELRQRFKQLI